MVVVAGVPGHHYDARDAVAEAYARVFLVNAGLATQLEVAKAFGCSDRTIRRDAERHARDGMAGLLEPERLAPRPVSSFGPPDTG